MTDRSGTAFEVGSTLAVGAHNALVNQAMPAPLDDAVNVLAAIGLTVAARRNGFTWDDLGMGRRELPRGIAIGSAAGLLAIGAVTYAASIPSARRFFHDERVARDGAIGALYHSALRIPIATALVEEVIFRGVLEVAVSRRRSHAVVATWTSLLFGLSHILPTLRTWEGNAASRAVGSRGRLIAVVGSVVSTSIAGAGFRWLRNSSGSLAAPVLTHSALNVTAYVAGRSITRRETCDSCSSV